VYNPLIGAWSGAEFLDNSGGRELDVDLRSTLPPYIVVDSNLEAIIRSRRPTIMDLTESRHKVAFVGASGIWYMRR
jgi:hypothetical protein